MNTKVSTSSFAVEDQFGRRVAARLSAGSQELPHDIGERLRVARAQAVAMRKQAPQLRSASVIMQSGHVATMGGGWWTRIGSVVPLIALVAGLITIGIESMYAVAMPVTALVRPGPDVTSATPTSPVARA